MHIASCAFFLHVSLLYSLPSDFHWFLPLLTRSKEVVRTWLLSAEQQRTCRKPGRIVIRNRNLLFKLFVLCANLFTFLICRGEDEEWRSWRFVCDLTKGKGWNIPQRLKENSRKSSNLTQAPLNQISRLLILTFCRLTAILFLLLIVGLLN